MFKPGEDLLGQYHELDGTIEFYGRINSIINKNHKVLDLGAGRGAWFYEDQCDFRKNLRNLKNKASHVIGADIDEAVLSNPTNHENIIIKDGKIPLEDNTIDIIIADWVLEHVENPKEFYDEIDRILKEGGIFCARTPHKYKYVSLMASLIKNKHHSKILKIIQPSRKEIDTFPTVFKLNTIKSLKKYFKSYENYSYLYMSHPSYYGNNKLLFKIFSLIHNYLPKVFVSEIFVFFKKKNII